MCKDVPAPSATDPLAAALQVVGDAWTLRIVAALDAPCRFSDLAARLPGIPSNVLASRLRRLVSGGLVAKRMYQRHPPRAQYSLTRHGEALRPAIALLAAWQAGKAPAARYARAMAAANAAPQPMPAALAPA